MQLDDQVEPSRHPKQENDWLADPAHDELLIANETDRFKTLRLEILRDVHDRSGIELVLIGIRVSRR